jgi:hypothetical protein
MADVEFPGSLPGERWRAAKIDGYEVSNLGRVKSLRRGNPKLRRLVPDKDGYLRVSLGSRGQPERGNYSVHGLVLEAFHGPCPDGCEADHRDGDRSNNKLSNLRWLSRERNVELRNVAKGKRNPTSARNSGGVRCEHSNKDGTQCKSRAYRMVVTKHKHIWSCGPHIAMLKRDGDFIDALTPEEVDEIDN